MKNPQFLFFLIVFLLPVYSNGNSSLITIKTGEYDGSYETTNLPSDFAIEIHSLDSNGFWYAGSRSFTIQIQSDNGASINTSRLQFILFGEEVIDLIPAFKYSAANNNLILKNDYADDFSESVGTGMAEIHLNGFDSLGRRFGFQINFRKRVVDATRM